MSQVFKAPQKYDLTGKVGVFLAGSIEMGQAEPWQPRLTDKLAHHGSVVILNPRRDNWDSSWTQEKENPQFNEQVTWELQAQEDATIIAMYFDPNTKSPITLLELGLFCEAGKLVVCCPRGFYRKGNVDIVCERYGIKLVETFDDLVAEVEKRVTEQVDRLAESLW